MVNILPEQLSDVLMGILEEYDEQIVEGSCKAVDKTMRRMVSRSKADAPKRELPGRPAGTYANHITSKVLSRSKTEYTKVWYVKAPEYPLTHLLNNGHALHQGGRWEGTGFLTKIAEDEKKSFEEAVRQVIADASR